VSGEWHFDEASDAVRSGKAFDDLGDTDRASLDRCLKPNCLGINLSILEYSSKAQQSSEIQFEHVPTYEI